MNKAFYRCQLLANFTISGEFSRVCRWTHPLNITASPSPLSFWAIIRSRRETRTPISPNSVQRHPLSPPGALFTSSGLLWVTQGVYVRCTARTFLPMCSTVACVEENVGVYVREAIEQPCSNCAQLRISDGDELWDLQYNCDLLDCRRRKNYTPVQDVGICMWRDIGKRIIDFEVNAPIGKLFRCSENKWRILCA